MSSTKSSTIPNPEFGVSFNEFKNVTFLESDTPLGLQKQLASIHMQYRLVSIYKSGSNHIAWILPMRKLTKRIKQDDSNK